MKSSRVSAVTLPRVLIALVVVVCLYGTFRLGQSSFQKQPKATLDPLNVPLVHVNGDGGAPGEDFDPETSPWIETIGWNPRVFLYHNILSQDECQHIIDMGAAHVQRSMVVGVTGKSVENSARSSSGVFLTGSMRTDEVVLKLQRKIADWTQLPEENGEVFYLIRYESGQEYKPHFDFFSNDENGKAFIGKAGNRVATVLTYLHAPEEGGETVFPRGDLSVPVKAGDAVLFWNMNPDGSTDDNSLHGGSPVIKGVKWAMTKWIRVNKF
eukprot:TRINITY_DN10835_c0_g1_i1.p1 TRINITY_DN10835_c0_g1~~TRINITY_DN10835_c0_g1_i1.p1  ORF type:complete len:289 (+),score=71.10 TRINITY_DN10835_c0_g1_i1:64-867(+)